MTKPSDKRNVSPKLAGEIDSSKGDPDTETKAVDPTSTPMNGSSPPSSIIPGQVFGQYEIEAKISEGSFGAVYKAYQPKLERYVALKIPKLSTSTDQKHISRFLMEARILAKIEHPGIVPIYDYGELESGIPFVVMRLLDGKTLESIRAEEAVNWQRACELGAAIAEALSCAHNMDVVHRDLKPANILLDGNGNPLVADFGLAVHYDNQLNHEDEIAGTIAYMSPEQIRGETHWLDGRTDIWSLGVMLYEMAAQRHPFRGKGKKLLKEILNRDPWPLRQIDPAIPIEFERIVTKCLEKKTGDRFSTADELASSLRLVLQSEHDSSSVSETGPPRLQWTIAALGATVIVVVLAIRFFGGLVSSREPGHGSIPNRSHATTRSVQVSTQDAGPLERADVPATETAAVASQSSSTLTGTIDVLVWDPGNQERRGLGIRDPQALPLHPGDQIRLNVQLNRAAFLYLVWIDSEGHAVPVYPWKPGDWEIRPREEQKTETLSLPETGDHGWPLTGAAGMETLMVLARDTPLRGDTELKTYFENLPLQPMQDPRAIVWFHDGKILTKQEDRVRGPSFFNEAKIDDPLLQTQRILYDRLHAEFDLVTAVSFAKHVE